jgi:hypothetical protein
MTCDACARAVDDPETGLVFSGCLGCEVRSVSQAPAWARTDYYARIEDTEEREAFIEAVRLEYERRQKLRGVVQ